MLLATASSTVEVRQVGVIATLVDSELESSLAINGRALVAGFRGEIHYDLTNLLLLLHLLFIKTY